HWCHVMDKNTYADDDVAALISKHYIAVKVDQDSRPDLSNRYEDYGWPATVIFAPDGKEIVKRQGYIPPKPMARLLQACVDDPTPGPSVLQEAKYSLGNEAALNAELRAKLQQALRERYDERNKGWHFVHKYLDWDNTEYCMMQDDPHTAKMADE